MNKSPNRLIYIKGGHAIEEASRLFPEIGKLLNGGPDQFLLGVLYHIKDSAFRLVTYGPKTIKQVINEKEATEYGVRPDSSNIFIRRICFLIGAISFFIDTLKFKPTHILCGEDGPFALIAWTCTRLLGAKFFFSVHNALSLPSISSYYKFASKTLCKNADAVIVHGPFLKDQALMLGTKPERLIEFNSSIDESTKQFIEKLKSTQTELKDNLTVLYLGRVEEDKGAIDLFNAYISLPNSKNIKLKYIGEGRAVVKLKELIFEHRLSDSVFLLGNLPHAEVFEHLLQSTVLVTPSQQTFREGRCKSAMEAFYVGTPVIAPDYGPFPYLVSHEVNGLLYTPDDITELKNSMLRILTDEKLRKSLNQGAEQTGKELLVSKTNFHEAIDFVLKNY